MKIKKLFLRLIKIFYSLFLVIKSKLAFIQYLILSNYLKIDDVNKVKNGETIIIEMMWKNPNHMFRLWLVILALKKINLSNIIVILWKEVLIPNYIKNWIKNAKILYIDKNIKSEHIILAKNLFKQINSHKEFLDIKLPNNIPPYIIYDTVLKKTRKAQTELSDKEWILSLAEFFNLNEQFHKIINNYNPDKVFVSHAAKNEFCTLIFNSLTKSIPVFHLTGFCESVRIRKIETTQDFNLPVDHLTYSNFLKQSEITKTKLSILGFDELKKRQSGKIDDINIQYAYGKKLEHNGKILNVKNKRIKVLVATHAWFDYPHIFGMKNFTDFLDFTKFTIENAKKNKKVDWFFKPHPAEDWYGGIKLEDILPKNQPNMFLVGSSDGQSLPLTYFDIVITVHGTIALEASILNKIVVCADNSYYNDWGFVHNPRSKRDYKLILSNIENLKPLKNNTKKLAAACLYGALGSPIKSSKRLHLSCDSLGMNLVPKIINQIRKDKNKISSEILLLKDWFMSNHKNFSAQQAINLVKKDDNVFN